MKHCVLILVHENIELVNKLLLLYPKEVDIYIHIDSSCNINKNDIIKLPNIKLILRRVYCEWCKMSLVNAELELIKESSVRNYDYYHLTSGSCIPLCTIEDLNKLEYPKLYLDSKKTGENWFFGSLWWSLSRVAVTYLLTVTNMYELQKLLPNLCPDEWLIQTILSRKFPDLVTKDNKRFIIMKGTHPRLVTTDDDLSGYLFARKVDIKFVKHWFDSNTALQLS